MHPHIHDSMMFLYKKPRVTYEELLSKTFTSVKSKAAIVENEASRSLQKLTEEISALTMVVKSASMGTSKTKTPNHKTKVNSLKGNGNKSSNANGNQPQERKRASCISCRTLQT